MWDTKKRKGCPITYDKKFMCAVIRAIINSEELLEKFKCQCLGAPEVRSILQKFRSNASCRKIEGPIKQWLNKRRHYILNVLKSNNRLSLTYSKRICCSKEIINEALKCYVQTPDLVRRNNTVEDNLKLLEKKKLSMGRCGSISLINLYTNDMVVGQHNNNLYKTFEDNIKLELSESMGNNISSGCVNPNLTTLNICEDCLRMVKSFESIHDVVGMQSIACGPTDTWKTEFENNCSENDSDKSLVTESFFDISNMAKSTGLKKGTRGRPKTKLNNKFKRSRKKTKMVLRSDCTSEMKRLRMKQIKKTKSIKNERKSNKTFIIPTVVEKYMRQYRNDTGDHTNYEHKTPRSLVDLRNSEKTVIPTRFSSVDIIQNCITTIDLTADSSPSVSQSKISKRKS